MVRLEANCFRLSMLFGVGIHCVHAFDSSLAVDVEKWISKARESNKPKPFLDVRKSVCSGLICL